MADWLFNVLDKSQTTLVFKINNIYLSTQQITTTKQMLTTLWRVIIPTPPERGGGGEEGPCIKWLLTD